MVRPRSAKCGTFGMLFLHFDMARVMVELRVTGRCVAMAFGVKEEEWNAVGGVDEGMDVETDDSFVLKGEDSTVADVGDEENLVLLSLLLLFFSSKPPSSAFFLFLLFFPEASSVNQPPMTPHQPTNTLSISSSFSTSTLPTPATVGSFSHSRKRESDIAINESRYVCIKEGGGYTGHGREEDADAVNFSALIEARFNNPDVDAIPDEDIGDTSPQSSDVSAMA